MYSSAHGLGIHHLRRMIPDGKGEGLSGDAGVNANVNATLRLSASWVLVTAVCQLSYLEGRS